MKECGFSICAELMREALGYHLHTAERQSATKTLSRLTDCQSTTIGLTDRQQKVELTMANNGEIGFLVLQSVSVVPF
jgi:hypothetical protein